MITYGFILTSLIVVLVPGTGVIYTVSTGITGSKKESIAAAVGCTAGIIPHLAAGILGLSVILHTGALVFRVIKIAGIIYLLYLGCGLILDKTGIEITESDSGEKKMKIIVRGILLNLLNPKLTLFFFSFLPQFITNNQYSYIHQMIALSIFFMGLTLVIFIIYGLLANYFKQLFIASPNLVRRIQQGFGAVFIFLAAKLALSDD